MHAHVGFKPIRHLGVGPNEPQGPAAWVGQDCGRQWDACVRVHDHPHWIPAADGAYRQLAVVGLHGSGADEDGVNQGPQPVKVFPVRFPGDETGVPGA